MQLIVNVKGGLGNQMFQYALGRKLALANGTPLFLDLSFYDLNDGAHTQRPFELDAFALEYSPATPEMLRPFQRLRSSRIQRMMPWRSHRIVTETGFGFDPAVLQATGNVYLDGHWQSEKYFDDVRATIRREFTYPLDAHPRIQEALDAITRTNAVSVHVRRGDYITSDSANAVHGACGVDHYERAMDLMLQQVNEPEFFVFSDDLQWARDHLRSKAPMHFVDLGDDVRAHNDMQLMSRCKHHIIANSSFSWWGAWLNASVDKVVVAPKAWFRDPAIDTSDLIPTGWHRL